MGVSRTGLTRRDALKLLGIVPAGLAAGALASRLRLPAPDPAAPNIVLLLFDAFSAAHLAANGYPRNTAPNLARFAQRAVVYHRHYAAANFTTPGVASLLTGVYPWRHRAVHLFGNALPEYAAANLFAYLSPHYYTLAYTHNAAASLLLDQFRAGIDELIPAGEFALLADTWAEGAPRDYAAAFRAEQLARGYYFQPSSLFLSAAAESRRGAQLGRLASLAAAFPRGLPNNASGLFFRLEEVVDWLPAKLAQLPRPSFSYIHLYPPHDPYAARADFVDIFDDGWTPPHKPEHAFTHGVPPDTLRLQRRHYDEYIAYADAEFGRLYDLLRASGQLDHTLFIVTSDHGELFERGVLGHDNRLLYTPLLHVPLLIARPGQRERTDVLTPTSAVDLLPTLLHAAGIPIPGGLDGEPLPALGGQPPPERAVFALEAKESSKFAAPRRYTAAVIRGRHKLITYRGYPGIPERAELFDLENDPAELHDLAASHPALAAELQNALPLVQPGNGNE
jgi:arylsulfatase A-like enzyme